MKKEQSQASLYDQLKELYDLANKAGLYDAADFLKVQINIIEHKVRMVNSYKHE